VYEIFLSTGTKLALSMETLILHRKWAICFSVLEWNYAFSKFFSIPNRQWKMHSESLFMVLSVHMKVRHF